MIDSHFRPDIVLLTFSATIVVSYLMKSKKLSRDDAIEQVKLVRIVPESLRVLLNACVSMNKFKILNIRIVEKAYSSEWRISTPIEILWG